MAAPMGAAISQSAPSLPRTLTLRIDNDAFDFWMLPWNRPDEEYTSGVHITLDGGDAPRWARRALARLQPCAVGASECRTGRMEIGQDIYTPSVSQDSGRAAPGARPNGGWLYLSQGARWLSERRSSELTIALGVTGEPSLARFTQRLAHDAAPQFNRATDWSRSIGFEPGAIVRFERRARGVLANGEAFGADVIPRGSIAAGNIRTAAEAGFQLRAGWHLSHPWLPVARTPELSVFAGGFGQAVARDIFLDGNSFRAGPRVGHRPFIGAGEMGLSIRYGAFDLGYRATNETRSWSGGPTWHPWGTLVGSVQF